MYKHFSHSLFHCNRLLALALALQAFGYAQSSLGGLTGRVVDSHGKPLAGATVELFEPGRKELGWTATSSSSGEYQFVGIPPGSYTVVVKLDGFDTKYVNGVPVLAGTEGRQEVRLKTGAPATSTQSAAHHIATTQTVDLGASAISELPLAQRQASSVAGLLSNVVPDGTGQISVNGARVRSNGILVEGNETNLLASRAEGLQLTNLDAMSEVTVQAGAADARYGRAGGAIVNQTLRSGGDAFHGSLSVQVENSALNALSNTQANSNYVKSFDKAAPGSDQRYTLAMGGPILPGSTYWFAGYQWRTNSAESTAAFTTLTQRGRDLLRGRFPTGRNTNVDNLLGAMEASYATTNATNLPLGSSRGDIEVGTFYRSDRQSASAHQPLFKLDHRASDSDFLTFHALLDRNSSDSFGPMTLNGFENGFRRNYAALGAGWTKVISARTSNEARFFMNTQRADRTFEGSNLLASTLPLISIEGLSNIGAGPAIPNGVRGNSYGFQERLQTLIGRHRISLGLELARETSRQTLSFNELGALTFTSGGGFSALANYVDNFGGTTGLATRDFGSNSFRTQAWRQSYYLQDEWQLLPSLKFTIGARYDLFGQPFRSIETAGYGGIFNLDPTTFEGPYNRNNPIKADRNNFAPHLGVAFSPAAQEGPLGWLLGDRATVLRAGASTGYDSWFSDLLRGPASSSPFVVTTQMLSQAPTTVSRGASSWLGQVPAEVRTVTALDNQTQISRRLENPYYIRLYAGLQREFAHQIVLDVAYVGTRGRQLYQMEDLNPLVPQSARIFPDGYSAATIPAANQSQRLDALQGQRLVVGNAGKSNYNALQVNVQRRMRGGLMLQAGYTLSRLMDTASDVYDGTGAFGGVALAQMPSALGGLGQEWGLSSLDRKHRGVISYVYDLPFFKGRKDAAGLLLGGWQMAGIGTLQSGTPYSLLNGLDADGYGGASTDRPDYNASGQPGVRAVLSSTSPTGYINPDAGNAPIAASDAMYIQRPTCTSASGCRAGTLGRNALRSASLFNWDANVQKSFALGERSRVQFRADFLNLLNKPQYGMLSASSLYAPSGMSIGNNLQSTLGGRFLNEGMLDGGGRTVRLMLRLLF